MQFQRWHQQTLKKVEVVPEWKLYFRSLILGLVIFGVGYAYLYWLEIPHQLNKSIADTAIILIGLSMLLSSLCYFWDFVDTKIVYRKQLGLVGFAFAILHIALSWDVAQKLFTLSNWGEEFMRPVIAGALAIVIFIIMAFVSNKFAAYELGGIWWRRILRWGYLAVFFTFLHVFWLKSSYWIKWLDGGLSRPPSSSLIVSVFMLIVIIARIALWLSLIKNKKSISK